MNEGRDGKGGFGWCRGLIVSSFTFKYTALHHEKTLKKLHFQRDTSSGLGNGHSAGIHNR